MAVSQAPSPPFPHGGRGRWVFLDGSFAPSLSTYSCTRSPTSGLPLFPASRNFPLSACRGLLPSFSAMCPQTFLPYHIPFFSQPFFSQTPPSLPDWRAATVYSIEFLATPSTPVVSIRAPVSQSFFSSTRRRARALFSPTLSLLKAEAAPSPPGAKRRPHLHIAVLAPFLHLELLRAVCPVPLFFFISS